MSPKFLLGLGLDPSSSSWFWRCCWLNGVLVDIFPSRCHRSLSADHRYLQWAGTQNYIVHKQTFLSWDIETTFLHLHYHCSSKAALCWCWPKTINWIIYCLIESVQGKLTLHHHPMTKRTRPWEKLVEGDGNCSIGSPCHGNQESSHFPAAARPGLMNKTITSASLILISPFTYLTIFLINMQRGVWCIKCGGHSTPWHRSLSRS